MSEKEGQRDSNITISVPLDVINDMLYSKTFVDETDPIYGKGSNNPLQAKAIIAGKSITLFKFRPKLKLKQIEITPTNGRPKLHAQAWFHFSPTEEENNQEDYPYDIAKAKDGIKVDADLDISIDQTKGKIQINPKYAVVEAKVSSGGGENEPEPFCQLSIPLQLEKLKVELPLGISTFNVSFPAPINKTFINSGSEFPIQGAIDKNSVIFTYPIALEEKEK